MKPDLTLLGYGCDPGAVTLGMAQTVAPGQVGVGPSVFALFERGFNTHGGSLNRGMYLDVMLRHAGFYVTEFSASYPKLVDVRRSPENGGSLCAMGRQQGTIRSGG